VWWGIGIVAVNVSYGWIGLAGSLLMNFFLLRVSGVPMLEKSMSKRRPGYEEYKQRTSGFVPRRPKQI
jgi:steroid 5-alpha reductase family enzyme